MLLIILLLIDIHTLLMFVLKSFLPLSYSFSGGSLAILKGTIFFIMSRDVFSFIDIIVGLFVIINLFFSLPGFIVFFIYVYLVYKIVATLASLA